MHYIYLLLQPIFHIKTLLYHEKQWWSSTNRKSSISNCVLDIFFFCHNSSINENYMYILCATLMNSYTAVNELQHQCKLHNMEPKIMNTNMWKCDEMPHFYHLYHFFITIYQPNILKFIMNLNKIINFNKECFLFTNHHTLL